MSTLGAILYWLAVVGQLIGGLALLGLFLVGIYDLFFSGMLQGFMVIGGVVVGGWVLNLACGIVAAAGMAMMEKD